MHGNSRRLVQFFSFMFCGYRNTFHYYQRVVRWTHTNCRFLYTLKSFTHGSLGVCASNDPDRPGLMNSIWELATIMSTPMAVNNGCISFIRNDRLWIPEEDFSTKAEIQACVVGTMMELPNCLYFKALLSDVQFCLDVDFFPLGFIFLEFLLGFQYKKGHLITILDNISSKNYFGTSPGWLFQQDIYKLQIITFARM